MYIGVNLIYGRYYSIAYCDESRNPSPYFCKKGNSQFITKKQINSVYASPWHSHAIYFFVILSSFRCKYVLVYFVID